MDRLLVIHYMLLVISGWLIIGTLGLLNLRRTAVVVHVLFPAGAVLALALCALGLLGVFSGPQELILPLGLPNLPFHVRLDSLSAYFLCILGAVSVGINAFSAGYFRKG